MSGKIMHYAAWFGPVFMFVTGLGIIIYLPSSYSYISSSRIPQWTFSLPDKAGTVKRVSETRMNSHSVMTDPLESIGSLLPEGEKQDEKLPVLRLSMIIRTDDRIFCRINDRLYGEDGTGPGFAVKTIKSDYADIMMDNGMMMRLYLDGHTDMER